MSTKLVKATFLLYPTADVILPPLTSKVPKYILEGLPKVGELLKSRKKYKEISISSLKVNDKYLFSTEGNASPLRLEKGERAILSHSQSRIWTQSYPSNSQPSFNPLRRV
ncbi:MAG: hypothetical protein MPF33_05490 [Candidatus Aramenus sp.]|jgi:hypothetical protein|nr:hypothetical protein [Candidatus Aramenus sp.]